MSESKPGVLVMGPALEYLKVPSNSRPSVVYTVTVVELVYPVSCTCEGFRYGIQKKQPYACVHMRDVFAEKQGRTA